MGEQKENIVYSNIQTSTEQIRRLCRSSTTPDVGEFPLTACEYELFGLVKAYVYLADSFVGRATICSHRYVITQRRNMKYFDSRSPTANVLLHVDLCEISIVRMLSMICMVVVAFGIFVCWVRSSNRLESVFFFPGLSSFQA